jgi:hypothetical protein
MGYGHRAGRVQSQTSRRLRNATRRLEELERARVTSGSPSLPGRLGSRSVSWPRVPMKARSPWYPCGTSECRAGSRWTA